MQNPEGEFYSVNYSPDSQWITYTKSGKNNMSVVYVYHLTSGKEYPVTEKWYDSSSPCFSTDGKYLIFTSERDFNPIYSQTEWNHAYNRMGEYILLYSPKIPHLLSCHRTKKSASKIMLPETKPQPKKIKRITKPVKQPE